MIKIKKNIFFFCIVHMEYGGHMLLVAWAVKNLSGMQETWVQLLDWENPLEKGMANHSSFLAGIIPWTEYGIAESVRHSWATNTHTCFWNNIHHGFGQLSKFRRHAINKAEHGKLDVFVLWCWRKLLRVPWTARILNQSILKQINPEYSLKRLMLKLKLQYFGHPMWRADLLEKTLVLGKTEHRRRRGCQRMKWLNGIIDSMDMNLSKLQKIVKDREACHAAVHGVTKRRMPLSHGTTARTYFFLLINSGRLRGGFFGL